MTDQEQTPFNPLPFQQLNQQEEPAEDAPRKRGPRRGWKKDKAKAETASRKPRAPNGAAKPSGIDALQAMQAVVGLTSDDTKLVVGVVQALQAFDRESQQRIIGALGRIFNG